MSFHEIDDTLVDYFKQMLSEESELCDTKEESKILKAEQTSKEDDFVIDTSSLEECTQSENIEDNTENLAQCADACDDTVIDTDQNEELSADDNDTQADDSFDVNENEPSLIDNPISDDLSVSSSLAHFEKIAQITHSDEDSEIAKSDESTSQITVQTQSAPDEQVATSNELPFAEPHPLEKLLEKVDTKTETQTETQTEEEIETQTQTQIETETKISQVEQVQDVKSEQKDAATQEEVHTEDNSQSKEEWHNIELPKEFQALFFLVKGIRFAVPLVNLGGIFQSEKITPLFGKPKWFMGIADIRGKKMNVVDTLKWVKSDAPDCENYEYKIALDNTLWSIGCDELEGNRILSNESVTWRTHAGNRPWLAGIVKKEMCALLHVEELIKMFEKGVNLKDLDLQMSE